MNEITNISKVTSKYQLPDGKIETNEVSSNPTVTMYMTDALVKTKVSAKQFAFASDEIIQTITLSNNADYAVTNMQIKETITTGANFKTGSVTINGTPRTDFNIVQGFTLPDSIPTGGAPVEIGYTLVVGASPFPANEVTLSTHLKYSVSGTQGLEEDLTPVTIQLIDEDITLTKVATPTAVVSGQKITFINIVKNNGNQTNTEVMFSDPMPEGASFVTGSVLINDVEKPDLNVEDGFQLPDLAPNGEVKVAFEVLVD